MEKATTTTGNMTDTTPHMKKSASSFTGWVPKIPFDRLNQTSDFEEFACSPPDGTEFICGLDMPPAPPVTSSSASTGLLAQTNLQKNQQRLHNQKTFLMAKPGVGNNYLRVREPSAADLTSSVPSSKEGTPCGTPQSSPCIPRKPFHVLTSSSEHEESIDQGHGHSYGANMLNPKKWFYSGFFAAENKTCASNNATSSTCHSDPLKKSTFRKFTVTNFDINAVGPTSW